MKPSHPKAVDQEPAMLTPLSILSRDQGKLDAKPLTEDAYYARFAGRPAKAPKVASPRAWYFLEFGLEGFWVNPGK
jgi:hypothetical protein